jgi:hypothetical protein
MTADEFRSLALGFPGASESAHMNHPDFRVNGKIFATLGYPDETCGMVKLTPDQQWSFVKKAPKVFTPCNGAWGQRGATSIHLGQSTKTLAKTSLKAAWENVTKKERT